MKAILRTLASVLGLLAAAGCGDDGSIGAGTQTDALCPVVVSEAACDRSQRPIVFVHGTFGSGDNIGNVALLFGSNGFCQERFVAVDYDSVVARNPIAALDALVDQVRADTGFDTVDLMGHSQGTMHAYTYLGDPARAAKVAHYVHLAGGPRDAPPGGVPTLSISSNNDVIAQAPGVTGAEKTVVFDWQDHFAVASSTESFVEIYRYLEGKEPRHQDIQCGDQTVTIQGLQETFGDNTPAPGTVTIYELGDVPRDRGAPAVTFTAGADGVFGPWRARRNQAYELQGDYGHAYFPPFRRSNLLLRILVPSTGITAIITDQIVTDDRHAAVVARSLKGAFRQDRGDSLTVDGVEVLAPDLASASTTTVGFFMFDGNDNQMTDLGSLPAYASTPFIRGTDVFMQASTPAFIQMTFGATTLKIPNWPSASAGQISIMFP